MNRPSLTIYNEKETEFEFDVSIQGVPAHEANVRFVIEGGLYDTTINCVRNTSNNKWLAKIPNMRVDESAKNFRVEVIAGGYYFCPSQGSVKVMSSPRVKVAEMTQHTEAKPSIKVSAYMTPIEQPKSLIMMESLTPTARDGLFKRCKAAGQIFSRAASIMQMPVSEQRKVTTDALVEILEAVKKAVNMVEVKVYM
jgi:DNA-binding TFAR19-related protein (PDSD5 family)